MIELPKQLKNKKFKFIKIDDGTKKPIEEKWAEDNNYRYNEAELKQYLKTATSYGIVCGYGDLVIVDIENIEDKSVANMVMQHRFPSTFTVQTGSGGWHLYYFVSDIKKRIRLIKDEQHYGEIQAKGNQCIGPGSLHPNGNKYTVLNDEEIKIITKTDLLNILNEYIEEEDTSKFKYNISKGLNWDIGRLLNECIKRGNLKTSDGIKYRGAHPVHGSAGGQNFEIDLTKNTWYCFRCEVGGDAVSLLAMLEGIVKVDGFCATQEQVKKEFTTIKNVGIEKYGFPDDDYESQKCKSENLTLFVKVGRKQKLNVEGIVDYIRSLYYIISIEDATGRATHIYVYDNGYYRLDGESILRTFIKKIFSNADSPWSSHYESEIINYLKTQNPVKRDELQLDTNLINFNNGIYDINTRKLKKHTHTAYFLYKIPWNYRPKAKLTRELIKYFNTTFSKKQEYIDFTQELYGYCLYSQYKFHGLFYLYGTGGNGKTVWLTVLQRLLGEENVVNKSISSLVTNRFTTCQLYGRLLNACGELSGYVLTHTDMLKRLTAGERIEAEFKNKDGFDFHNTAKIITAGNSIPASPDDTDGWYDRQYILPFLQKFRFSEQQDNELIEKLVTKVGMEGLLAWAVAGLHRLLDNKEFTYTRDKKEKYLMHQGNTKYFVGNFYKRSDNLNDYVTIDQIREDYEEWCRENDVPIDSNQALSRAFRYFKLPDIELISKNNEKIYVRSGIKKVTKNGKM